MSGDGAVWVAILGSLAMAIAAACVFVIAVKHHHFDDLEDTKYQIFWADRDDSPPGPVEEDGAHATHRRP